MRRQSTPCDLSERCRQRLNMYAVAAGGAAMGLLAQAPQAQAKVIYTAANHPILHNTRFDLDLNHDGKTDFEINQMAGCSGTGFCNARLYAYAPFYHDHGNAAAGQGAWPFHALALRRGSEIGPQLPFGATALYFRSGSIHSAGRVTGSWIDVKDRYLGLKLKVQGEVHYGWARLSVDPNLTFGVVARLTGYAYETTAGKPIRAGQTEDAGPALDAGSAVPAVRGAAEARSHRLTLGALALGARGIAIWRREESARPA